MKLCHYSDILQIAARLSGQDYSRTVGSSGLDSEVEATLRVHINAELGDLWSQANWPGLRRVEERTFRAPWSAATAYSAGTEVYDADSDEYYQALRASTNQAPTSGGTVNSAYWYLCAAEYAAEDYASGTSYAVGDTAFYPTTGLYYACHTASTGNSPTDTNYWGVLTEFDRYVSLTQAGETEISERGPISVFTENPDRVTQLEEINYTLTENGIQLLTGPNKVWVVFNIVPPDLVGEAIDLEATYAEGEQIQFSTSGGGVESIDFYDCVTATSAGETPTTTPAAWARVEIPDVFKTFLGARAAMALLVNDEDPRYSVAEQRAEAALRSLMDNLYRGQNQIPRTRVIGAN